MSLETTEETRINVRVRGPMAEHVQNLIGPQGMYESQSEYIRDLIRHDMTREDGDYPQFLEDTRKALRDIGSGNYEEWDREKSLAEAKAYAAAQK